MRQSILPMTNYPPAGMGKRISAFILDLVAVKIIAEFMLVIVLPIFFFEPTYLTLADGLLSFIIIPVFYWSYLTFKLGHTPGKRLFGLRVVSSDESELTFKRIFYRESLGKSISTIILGLGYLTAFFNEDKKAWHDKMFRTKVIEIG